MHQVLVIDDDTAVRIAIKTMLEHEGYGVTLAADGRQGLRALDRDHFDLVIIDIFMPGMDGLETIKMLQQRARKVPIIAMSGFMFRGSSTPAPDFLAMATKLGAICALHKPFRPAELLGAIEACLGQPLRVPRRARG